MKRCRALEGLNNKYAAMVNYYLSLPAKSFLEALKCFTRLGGFGDEYHDCEFSESKDKANFVIYYDWTSEVEISTMLSFDEYFYYLTEVSNVYLISCPESKKEVEDLLKEICTLFS